MMPTGTRGRTRFARALIAASLSAALLLIVHSGRPPFTVLHRGWWRHPVYALLSFGLAVFVYGALTSLHASARFERAVRLTLLLTVAVALFAGLYYDLNAVALASSLAGVFGGVLAITWQSTGLVEISGPEARVAGEVLRRHQAVLEDARNEPRAKRALDVMLSLVGLAISLPFLIPLSVAVWLEDPGPLFFGKVCVTRGGGSFRLLKLRSMVKEAERETGPTMAAPSDPRVTRVGRLVRRTGADELPQLWNILRGQMSFVGPRPQRTMLVDRHLRQMPDYARRHAVRPGLTGLAQVHGTYYLDPRRKLRYDLVYARRRHLLLDLRLIAVSLLIGVTGGLQNHQPRRVVRFFRRGVGRLRHLPLPRRRAVL